MGMNPPGSCLRTPWNADNCYLGLRPTVRLAIYEGAL